MSAQAAKPFILFITGISASGKTTIYEALKSDPNLSHLRFHDIDENGVPPVGRSAWRVFRVEDLLYRAIKNFKSNKSTVICGITKPHEVVESKYYQEKYNIHFLLVDISLDIFLKRVDKRIKDVDKKGDFDEVFNKDSYEELVVVTKNLIRILKNSALNQKNGHFIDATRLSKEKMITKTKELISWISQK